MSISIRITREMHFISTNVKELKENTLNHMNSLQSNLEKIANFFKHPSVAYLMFRVI